MIKYVENEGKRLLFIFSLCTTIPLSIKFNVELGKYMHKSRRFYFKEQHLFRMLVSNAR